MAFDHAIVLGGSITGLLAAAAASSEFDRVTIIDRDELIVDGPEAENSRRGVPQGDQVHHLLALGAERIEELLPGFDQDLLAAGGERHDNLAAFATWLKGAWRVRFESDLALTCFTRPLFESVIRKRVLALPNVTTLKSTVGGLIASEDNGTVIGARVKNAPEGQLLGDLVIDATGRGTKSPNWIQDFGYDRPTESHLRVYMGYTCYRVEIPEGVLPEGVVSVSSPSAADSESTRSIVVWPCGRGQHIVVGFGAMREYPPTDLEGIQALADSLDVPYLGEAVRAAKVLSEPKHYQMPGDQRILWEDLDRRPEGFVVLGDAVASYNPAYGQGMTMAAVGSVELRRVLRDAGGRIEGVADAFQKGLAPHVDMAWTNALGVDSKYVGAEYENLEPPQQAPPEYAAAFVGLQTEDPEVALAARLAMHWMDNSHIKTESIQKKIDGWIADGRTPKPEVCEPASIPALIQA